MSEIETLGILEEIGSLVSDHLQVVSYKWLSRNFLVSSNVAKKLLEEFVEKHSEGVEVIYTVSGWLKEEPKTYHVQLVPQPKLVEAKEDFDESFSAQVYSVQVSIPNDPALIWNPEFVQAEELVKQPFAIENCLRDNRFCGVSNPSVKRQTTGSPPSLAVPQAKTLSTSLQAQQTKQPSTKPGPNLSSVSNSGKGASDNAGATNLESKPASDKDKASLTGNKNKGQSDKVSAGSGRSIANMWSRASSKPKSTEAVAVADAKKDDQKILPKKDDQKILPKKDDQKILPKKDDQKINVSSESTANEAIADGNSDDDGIAVNFRRVSNGDSGKRRRAIIDDSDDEVDFEDAVNLGSPDPPSGKSVTSSKSKTRASNIKVKTMELEEVQEEKPKAKEEEKPTEEVLNQQSWNTSTLSGGMSKKNAPLEEKNGGKSSDDASQRNNTVGTVAPSSPKRRKVLKTRIDERGREVTEVVWEGEEPENKQTGDSTAANPSKKAEDKAPANPAKRVPATKKLPGNTATAPQPTGKAGNKKGSAKDPKQGNIMSFFKKT